MRLSVVVEADGGSRGNPGPAGYGAVVREARTGEVLAERLGTLGVATNNVAEYSGLIAGLTAAAELGAVDVEVRMDSKLVVEQMAGRWQIKHPGLRPLAAQAAALVNRFGSVRFTWIPREQNARADALANAAMDGESTVDPDPAPEPVPAPEPAPSWAPRTGTALRMLLVRHGATAYTAERRYSGRGDVPLSPAGQAQARATGARVAALGGVDVVVSSPLRRAVDTAHLLAGGAPVLVEPDLTECDFGDWEGLTFGEARERYPIELAAWLGETSVPAPGGESFDEVSVRVRRVMRRLRADHPGQRVAVVSHVTPIKMVLRDALAATDAFLHRCHLDPAGISIVDSWPDGGVSVRTVNDTAHLA